MDRSSAEPEPSPSRRDWLLVPLSLLLGALILIAGVLAWYLTGDRYVARLMPAQPGYQVNFVAGTGEWRGSTPVITGLDRNGVAALHLRTRGFQALDFESLRVKVSGLPPGMQVSLLWRDGRERTDQRTHLSQDESGMLVAALSDHSHWQGEIQSFVLLFEGSLSQALEIRDLELVPATPEGAADVLQRIWTQWTQFSPWSPRSINFVLLGETRHVLLSPVLASALWLGLATVIYVLFLLASRKRPGLVPFVVMLLVTWISLDMIWQWQIFRQSQASHDQFAGKTTPEKLQASADAWMYEFAQEVKGRIPEPTSRIFVFSPTLEEPRDYQRRVRLHYLLLPHNVGSQWIHPPMEDLLRSGDHLIVLPPHPLFTYRPDTGELRWGQAESEGIVVQRLFSSPAGDLYRVP